MIANTIMKINIKNTIARNEEAEEISTSPIFLKEDKYLNTFKSLKTRKDFKTLKLLTDLDKEDIKEC